MGSERIIALLSPDGAPLWIVHLERSNPFVDIEIRNQVARFSSSSAIHITVSVAGLEFTPTHWPTVA